MDRKAQMIEKLRNENTIENCEIKHYQDLDFVDIFENVDKTTKKKSISNIDTDNCTVGYFKNNKLIRLDKVGAEIPIETHVIWENENIKEAHEFYLGIRQGKRIANQEQISSSWFYTYENDVLKKIVWVMYEDRNYYNNGKMTITYDYEYDEKDLLFVQKTTLGEGEQWKEPDICILFDREKERFLKNCTISKSWLIAVASKISDNTVSFNAENRKTCLCTNCNTPLSFVASFSLLDKRFNINELQLDAVPILHCFNCLEIQNYSANSLQLPVENRTPFTEVVYRLKRELDAEKAEEAFLKAGGKPFWIQDDEHPVCIKCSKPMKFVVEINTDEDLSNGTNVLAFGDSGKLYVFSCCDNITTIPQWH